MLSGYRCIFASTLELILETEEFETISLTCRLCGYTMSSDIVVEEGMQRTMIIKENEVTCLECALQAGLVDPKIHEILQEAEDAMKNPEKLVKRPRRKMESRFENPVGPSVGSNTVALDAETDPHDFRTDES